MVCVVPTYRRWLYTGNTKDRRYRRRVDSFGIVHFFAGAEQLKLHGAARLQNIRRLSPSSPASPTSPDVFSASQGIVLPLHSLVLFVILTLWLALGSGLV